MEKTEHFHAGNSGFRLLLKCTARLWSAEACTDQYFPHRMKCSFNKSHTEIDSKILFSSSPTDNLHVLFFITPPCLVPAHSDGNVYITDSILLQESKCVRNEETLMFCFQNILRWQLWSPTWEATWMGAVLFSYLLSFQTDKWHQHCANTSSPSPNVVHNTPYRHPPIQHRWQVAKLNWHQNFPKYIISPQAWLGEPTVQFTCSFCLSAINRLKEVCFSIRSLQNRANEGVLSCLWEVRRTCKQKSTLVRLLCSDSGSVINSCASRKYGDKYTALRNTFCWLWHVLEKTRESADGWMDGGTQSCRWLFFNQSNGECLPELFTDAGACDGSH